MVVVRSMILSDLMAIYGYYFNRCISEKLRQIMVTSKRKMLFFQYASLSPTTFPILLINLNFAGCQVRLFGNTKHNYCSDNLCLHLSDCRQCQVRLPVTLATVWLSLSASVTSVFSVRAFTPEVAEIDHQRRCRETCLLKSMQNKGKDNAV